jgi:hypothetical protein
MAMAIFTALNGMAVVFLVYVLVQFWKEGRALRKEARRRHTAEFSEEDNPQVIVVTHAISGGLQPEPAPVSHRAHGGLFVVSVPRRENGLDEKQFGEDSASGADGMSMKRSTAS